MYAEYNNLNVKIAFLFVNPSWKYKRRNFPQLDSTFMGVNGKNKPRN